MGQKTESEKEWDNRRQFFMLLGECINSWAIVENCLSMCFQKITGMEQSMAQKIFYSTSGFGSRATMFSVAIDASGLGPLRKDYLKKLISKARNHSSARNKIMHGNVVYIGESHPHYPRQYVIIRGGNSPVSLDEPKDVLKEENLGIILSNFANLIICCHAAAHWDYAAPEIAPLNFLELVEKLPTEVHCTRLDPSTAAKFRPSGPVT